MNQLTDYLDSLPAYDTCEGEIWRLNLLRDFVNSPNEYYWKAYAVPNGYVDAAQTTDLLSEYQTFEQQINVPPGSYLVELSAYAEQFASPGVPTPGQFALQITEPESQCVVFQLLEPRGTLLGNFENLTNANNQDQPAGPTLLGPNLIVLNKGRLNVIVRNLTANPTRVQVMFEFAIPATPANTNRLPATAA